MESSHRVVHPTRPVAPYVGGKRNLALRLIERIEAVPHELYAEPFVGMAGVFLRRRLAPTVEVINDISRDVATLFRILQRHHQAFAEMLRWQLTSRADFDRLLQTEPDTLTDLERAARFLYLQRLSFGGKVNGRNFGVSRTSPARFDVTKLLPMLADVHERLAGVVIECLPFADFIRRYDRAGALFYVDPPYYGSEHYYGADLFPRDQFERLAELLAVVQGSWILSVNDTPETRSIFARFNVEAVSTTYTVRGGADAAPAGELIVSRVRQ